MFTRRGFHLFAVLAAVCLLLAATAYADSEARIVRLSYIDGDVQIDRNIGQGFEQAILNMPVVQGTRLYTGNDGRVEIEFENGSTVRLTGPCDLLVRQLTLRSSGDRVTMLELREGLAYFDVKRKGDEQFRVVIGSQELNLHKSAHFRLRVDRDDVQLAVMKGEVNYEAAGREVTVKKNESLALDLGDPERYFLAKNIDEYDSDQWDAARDQYRDQYETAEKYRRNSPYAWGWSDLDYYGSYMSAPGYGWVWRPYGVGVGWDPFSYGAWSWYPGFGWTYVSAYPWGWVPYRYGSWLFVDNFGWCWQPGTWNSWNTVPVVLNPPQHYIVPRAPTGPRRGGTIVTGLANPPRPSPPSSRPAPPGGVPSPIARGGGRVIVNDDLDRPIKGRPLGERPGISGGGLAGRPSANGRQSVEIQRPGPQTQIPADNIRVSPTDMRPPVASDEPRAIAKPTDDNDRGTERGRSPVFDRPRDSENDRATRGEPRVVPGPSVTREVPRGSAPITPNSNPRPSAPVSVTPSNSGMERSSPAPAPRSESHSSPSPAPTPRSSPPPSPPPAPSAPSSSPAPARVPAPSHRGR